MIVIVQQMCAFLWIGTCLGWHGQELAFEDYLERSLWKENIVSCSLKTTLFFSCVKWGYENYGKSHDLKYWTFCLFLIESRNCCGICFLDLLLFTMSLTVLGKLESALQPCQEDRAPMRSEPGSMLLDLGVGRASFGVFFYSFILWPQNF